MVNQEVRITFSTVILKQDLIDTIHFKPQDSFCFNALYEFRKWVWGSFHRELMRIKQISVGDAVILPTPPEGVNFFFPSSLTFT
jgi:hypothetical protein